ncbi:MAG: histidinol dehydrogenase [Verrucomicrobiae bacterium]|nr:histidinol dehydrogenase [Verrucomicrobiae bacterium]
MRVIRYPSPEFDRLAAASRLTEPAVTRAVTRILDAVRRRGDCALIEFARRFDRVRLGPRSLRVGARELRAARVDAALERAARRTLREVTAFARASLPRSWRARNGHGAVVGEKFDPLERVGVYVPGGQAPLVSTVFMTAALARTAGVAEIVACTPPPVSPAILWALRLCGVREVFRVGGAQAIAAMAYGTQAIRPVDKVFGPGSVWVTEAKRQVFGVVGVDLLAGPSELMVLADATVNPEWAAADLLAQAEHGTGKERIFCVGSSQAVLRTIRDAVEERMRAWPAHCSLRAVLSRNAAWILARTPEAMARAANRIAPEHLQVMTRDAEGLLRRLRTAGGVFLGNWTPTVLGDFVAGSSHTLPTGGAGRSFSGLRAADFMRRTSVTRYDRRALALAAEGVRAFSRVESLPAHGASLEARFA